MSSFNQESLYLGLGAEDFLVKALVKNTDDKIKGPITAEPLTSCICKSRRVLFLSSGKIHKISMLSGALKINQEKKVVGL